MQFSYLTISQVSDCLKKKDFSCAELTSYYLDRIEQLKSLNAFITVMAESAMKKAKETDEKISRKEALAGLEGVPISIKDLILTKGERTTAGSNILANYIAPYDATVVKTLKQSGAIILGKTNCDEFAMGSSNENSAFGPVLNPWDKSKVPGGSSGGSAAAVAADLGVFSIGTDAGSSIRQPASLCGIVGLKPTYGRVSRYGLAAMTSSLDQAGPLARCVEDAAMVLSVIAGHDEYDATSLEKEPDDYLSALSGSVKGKTIGIPKEYFETRMDKEVEDAILNSITVFKTLGVNFKEVSLPHTVYGLAAYHIIMPAEVSSNLARYDGIRYGHNSETANNLLDTYLKSRSEGFGDEAKRRIMIGTYVLSSGYQEAYYVHAKKVQRIITAEYEKIFNEVDALLTPTSPTAAFNLNEKTSDPLAMYLADIFTVSANIAGICGISAPAGFSSSGLPIGLQLLARPFAESEILRLAYNYQEATDWHKKRPIL